MGPARRRAGPHHRQRGGIRYTGAGRQPRSRGGDRSRNLVASVAVAGSLLIATVPPIAAAQAGFAYETENVAGSEIPVTYHLIMTSDGLYTPIGLRKPSGERPFPIVLFASGNGGEGVTYIKEYSHNRGWTLEQFLDVHGFAYVARGADGRYAPDAIQREVVADSIAFFDAHLKSVVDQAGECCRGGRGGALVSWPRRSR